MLNVKTFKSTRLHSRIARRAFTLIELLVVVAIIGILAAILLPVLHQAEIRGMTANCIDNQSQLSKAWIMYSSDNNDYCVGNNWGDEKNWMTYSNENWLSGWEDASQPLTDNTNTTLFVDPHWALLGDLTRLPKLYLCPASQVLAPAVSGGLPQLLCRTVSMNCWMGPNCVPPGAGQDAGGIPNYAGCSPYKNFPKTTSITAGIGPADAFVFMEERAESIDDGSFEVVMPKQTGGNTIANWPTDYHSGAATVGFADGHVETHRWFGINQSPWDTTEPQQATITAKWGTSQPISGSAARDLNWLQQHANAEN